MNVYGRFGRRFPALSDAYDRSLAKTALQTAQELGYSSFIQEGVYAAQVGPAFETPAECRFLSMVREKFSLFCRFVQQVWGFGCRWCFHVATVTVLTTF